MLKSEMQHQFWITKKTVQRKLGSKEDEHIISSDADLDAKIEVFKSISDTSFELGKIIDQYQERLCILSQEECVFGRFLKEVGKRSKTTGQSITNTGKAVSYSGQQRMCVRVPLLRLHQEVEVFRCRAVRDTQATLQAMEKERTEYRAALSWMKSASSELDPDSGRGLEKFRTAQSHVRVAKQNFDGLSMDCMQKVALLQAARCNMFSHALVSYMTELKQFAEKTASTFDTISRSLALKPKYDFCVLKDLTQDEGDPSDKISEIIAVDKDQSLFFADEYNDEEAKNQQAQTSSESQTAAQDENNEKTLIELTQQIDDIVGPIDDVDDAIHDIAQQAQQSNNFWSSLLPPIKSLATGMSVANAGGTARSDEEASQAVDTKKDKENQTNMTKAAKSANPWLDLFADLDPLANPEAFDLKLSGGRVNSQQT